jgi:hypothetical protein
MKQALDNLDKISRDSVVNTTELLMIARSKLHSIFKELSGVMLRTGRHESLALFRRAWAESTLTPELIMCRCTWL